MSNIFEAFRKVIFGFHPKLGRRQQAVNALLKDAKVVKGN
jgi:hypothetical protein